MARPELHPQLEGFLLFVQPQLPIIMTAPAPESPAAGDALPALQAAGAAWCRTVVTHGGMRIVLNFQRTVLYSRDSDR